MSIDYQAWVWKQRCPRCGKGPGRLSKIGRVTGTGTDRAIKVVCGDCRNFLRLRLKKEAR